MCVCEFQCVSVCVCFNLAAVSNLKLDTESFAAFVVASASDAPRLVSSRLVVPGNTLLGCVIIVS